MRFFSWYKVENYTKKMSVHECLALHDASVCEDCEDVIDVKLSCNKLRFHVSCDRVTLCIRDFKSRMGAFVQEDLWAEIF